MVHDGLLYEVDPGTPEGWVKVEVDAHAGTITYTYHDHHRTLPLTRERLVLAAARVAFLLEHGGGRVGALGETLHVRAGAQVAA